MLFLGIFYIFYKFEGPKLSKDSNGNEVLMEGRGRHDPCVVPRAVPIVEAMAALVILDYYLLNKTVKLK